MLQPRDRGITLWTLRFGDEVRDADAYFGDIDASKDDRKPDTRLRQMMARLIKERTTDWDPAMVNDPVQERLLEIIATKKKGRRRPARAKPEAEAPSNVISIMDALRKSLSAEDRNGRKGRNK